MRSINALLVLAILAILLAISNLCQASVVMVNIFHIAEIESSFRESPPDSMANARGLCQITPIVIKEYNKFNKTSYVMNDLFDPQFNMYIANWYANERIPQMLRCYKIKDTLKNRLICYNAGIKRCISYQKDGFLKDETINYLKKYGGLENDRITL